LTSGSLAKRVGSSLLEGGVLVSKRIFACVLALALVACASPVAIAASKHKVSVTVQQAVVSTSGNQLVNAGVVSGTYGAGAVVLRATVSGTTITVRGTVWYTRGTITGKGTFHSAVQADGSTTATGTLTVTGGTGKFKGATGSFTATGKSPPNDTAHSTVFLKGTLKY
jgi:hypothetical protein